MNKRQSYTRNHRRLALVAAIGAVAFSLLGCKHRAPAANLLASGNSAAGVTRTYYRSLQETVLDSWEFEAAFSNLTSVGFSQSEQSLYADRLAALDARARMAERLGQVYSAALELQGGSNAPAVAAAEDLGKALKSLPKLPSASINPSDVLGPAADGLLGFLRNRSLAKANGVITSVLDAVASLFSKEAIAYQSILSDREQSGQHLTEALARRRLVAITPLLHELSTRLGVPWNDSEAGSQPAESLALAISGITTKRAELLDACATTETEAMIVELAARHRDVASGRPINLDGLRRLTAAASDCLNQRAMLPKATSN